MITKKNNVVTDWDAKRVISNNTIIENFISLPLIINNETKPNTIGLSKGGDVIRASLNSAGSSIAAYDNASTNAWINITEAEYSQLKSNVGGVNIGGFNDAALTGIPLANNGGSWGGTNFSIIMKEQTSGSYAVNTLPGSSHVFAIALRVANSKALTSDTIGLSTGQTGTISWIGSLPSHSASSHNSTHHLEYFVLKSPNHVTSGVTYPAFLNSANTTYTTSMTMYWGTSGNTSGLIDNNNYSISYQMLSANTKQW